MIASRDTCAWPASASDSQTDRVASSSSSHHAHGPGCACPPCPRSRRPALSFVDTNDYPLPPGAGVATQQAAYAFLAPLLLGLVLNAFLIGCATPWLSAWLSASASGERSSTRWLVLISAARPAAAR